MRTPAKWLAGAACSVVVAWVVGAVFCNSPGMLEWSDEIDGIRRSPHVTMQFRTEGWATSRFGLLGLSGIADTNALRRPAVVVWGDSHVEALQVPDEEKMAGQLRILMTRDGMPRTAIGMGLSGEMVADYYFKMPGWEARLPCAAHYILVTAPSELLPDQPDATYARFTARPTLALVPPSAGGFSARRTLVQRWLRKLRLEFVVALHHKVGGGGRDRNMFSRLRFTMGPVRPRSEAAAPPPLNATAESEALDFLLGRLAVRTTNPVTVVYVPLYPGWERNRIVLEGRDAAQVDRLAEACRAHGVGFVDLRAEFARYHAETGRFPRGFPNGRPGVGHFNAEGHRLIAEAIYRDLSGGDRALLAD